MPITVAQFEQVRAKKAQLDAVRDALRALSDEEVALILIEQAETQGILLTLSQRDGVATSPCPASKLPLLSSQPCVVSSDSELSTTLPRARLMTSPNAYMPRRGTLADRVFKHLSQQHLYFKGLSECIAQETGLSGGALTNQLSVMLCQLVKRGSVVRIDPHTQKPALEKDRGLLYSLAVEAREAWGRRDQQEATTRNKGTHGVVGQSRSDAGSSPMDLTALADNTAEVEVSGIFAEELRVRVPPNGSQRGLLRRAPIARQRQ